MNIDAFRAALEEEKQTAYRRWEDLGDAYRANPQLETLRQWAAADGKFEAISAVLRALNASTVVK